MIRSPASRLSLVSFVAAFLSAGGMAQTLPRNVHPGIAPPASGALTGATAVPMFQFPDGVWNNFEGFAPAGQSSVDWGGWFNLDDGTHLTNSDVHSYFIPYPENSYWDDQHVFDSPVRPPAVRMRRFVGYMRPANVPLGPHPVFGGTWVDQGAFELFAPLAPWNGQTIVIVIGHFPTLGFPPNANHQSLWWPNTSLGWFSPDGLIREEFTGPGGFSQNIHDQDAGFPGPARAVSDLYVATWPGNSGSSSYYPICGYTFTVMQRPAELNMQSSLQLVQATKMLLMDAARTPLTRALTQSEIDTNVVVVFAGASNGGLQASWAAQLYPNIVHGAFAEVINPSMERLLGEQEFGYAVGCQSGFTPLSATFAPVDMRNWGQFTWNRGLELYDLSLPRQLLRGQIYRPFCQYIGDEDLTSTGTDWIRLSNPVGTFQQSGIAPAPNNANWFNAGLAWMSADKRCHESGFVTNPFTGQSTPNENDIIHDLIPLVIANRQHQIQTNQTTPSQPVPHVARVSPNEDLRGIDDPHEWYLGRLGQTPPTPQPGDILQRDDAFFNAVQPGAAGTWLGHKEARLILNGKLYVGSADGIVSCFQVNMQDQHLPLQRQAVTSRALGHQAWGMAALSSGELIVATRRHLFKLDPNTPDLAVLATSSIIPFEIAKPYRLHVGHVLANPAGDQIVFASAHGGLVFYDASLNFIREWSEPGILDFELSGSIVDIMSERGVVAAVHFTTLNQAELLGVSPPQNGIPGNLVLARLVFGNALTPVLVGLYGDQDGISLHVFDPANGHFLGIIPHIEQFSTNLGGSGGVIEIATVHHTEGNGMVGDHVMILNNGELILLNQNAQLVGKKSLLVADSAGALLDYTFGQLACNLVSGELAAGNMSSTYTEEVAVTTEAGHVVWLRLEDFDGNVTPYLSSLYTIQGQLNAVQPCTNDSMSACWAIDTTPNDNDLHVLDQSGNYWRIQYSGSKTLVRGLNLAGGTKRGWKYMGTPIVGAGFDPSFGDYTNYNDTGTPRIAGVRKLVWCPHEPIVTVYESTPNYVHNNWEKRQNTMNGFGNFLLFRRCGDILDRSATSGTREAWWWSYGGTNDLNPSAPVAAWGNLVEGMTMDTAGMVTHVWASTAWSSNSNGIADHLAYHDLRNSIEIFAAMDLQALKAVDLGGQTFLILACPGGRVRVLQPGAMTQGSVPHSLGSLVSSSDDFGTGGCALATKVNQTAGTVTIAVGTMYDHAPRNTYPAQPLQDNEVLAGAVRILTMNNNGQLTSPSVTIDLHPSAANPRGGYGVAGLLIDDLLPGTSYPGDELIVTTLSGDLFVYSLSGTLLFHTFVPGALGMYNSIIAKDLNGDHTKELYIAGSYGLFRFVQPGETHP